MGNSSGSKLHTLILFEDWDGVIKRIEKHPEEVLKTTSVKNLPIHAACYTGKAPPKIISSLVRHYPESVSIQNKAGFNPLYLARKNYALHSRHRHGVIGCLGAKKEEIEEAKKIFDDIEEAKKQEAMRVTQNEDKERKKPRTVAQGIGEEVVGEVVGHAVGGIVVGVFNCLTM